MIQRVIRIENAETTAAIFGAYDVNTRLIEGRFGVGLHNKSGEDGSDAVVITGEDQEAVNAAAKIGDDYLQKKAYGREMPESFNHGRSEWRVKWLTRGLQSGDPSLGDTFSIPYSQIGD